MLANYMTARAGISHLVDARERVLKEALYREVVKHYPGFTVESNSTFGTLHLWNRETKVIMSISGFARQVNGVVLNSLVTCPGAGKHQDLWDPSNWSSQDVTMEVQELIDAADIDNKLKVYRQELVAANETMQKVDKEQARLVKAYTRACAKVSKAEAKSGQDAGDWVEGYFENLAQDNMATYDLGYEPYGFQGYEVLWDDLVDEIKEAADITVGMLEDYE
jgi:hypothetical protein